MSQRLRPLLKIPINLTYRLNLTWNCATNGKKASLAPYLTQGLLNHIQANVRLQTKKQLAHLEDEAKQGGRAFYGIFSMAYTFIIQH